MAMRDLTIDEATIVLALDGHSLATQRADAMPFFAAMSVITALLNEGILVSADGYAAPFPALGATHAACQVWREQISARRPAIV
jgi:hypothetical protein